MKAVRRFDGRSLAMRRGLAGGRGAAPRIGLRARVLAGLTLTALVLAAGVGALYHQLQRAQAIEQARTAAAGAAEASVEDLLSFDHKTLDRDLAEDKKLTTGKLRADYARLSAGLVAPATEKQQIVTRTRVVASSVVSVEPGRVVTLMFVDQATTSKKLKSPQVERSRVRATMTKVDGEWLVSGLEPV